jgi:hypothetical protein
MKKYTIEVEEKDRGISVDGVMTSEVECALKVWQDLRKLNSENQEDQLIENILCQILQAEFGDDLPKGYEGEKIRMTDTNADLLKQRAETRIKEIEEEERRKRE